MKEFLTVLRRWRDFSGRSARREYWMYTLVLIIISFVLGILDGIISGESALTFGNVFWLVTLVPGASVSIRRLHDIDKSGWWLLLTFTVIGILVLIYWACVASDADENRYGSLPLADHEPSNRS